MRAGWCLTGLLMYFEINLWTNMYRPRGFWFCFQSGWTFLVTTDARGSYRWFSISGSGDFWLWSCLLGLGLPGVLATPEVWRMLRWNGSWFCIRTLIHSPVTHGNFFSVYVSNPVYHHAVVSWVSPGQFSLWNEYIFIYHWNMKITTSVCAAFQPYCKRRFVLCCGFYSFPAKL